MATRRPNPFTTVRSEGALLPPEILQRVTDLDPDLGGLRPADYHLGSGERLNEQISRSWNRLVGLWAAFEPKLDVLGDDPGTSPTREGWLLPLFDELGFGRLQTAKAVDIEGKSYPVSHRSQEGIPIHLVGAGLELDRRTPGVAGAARTSPHGLVQELLNRTDALWGMVSNGRSLRLLRDNISLTRQAFVEFDLESMMRGEVYADFALLWLLCHQSRFEAERPTDCWLERWSQAAQKQGTRALETLRGGVEEAIRQLGSGFLEAANPELKDHLREGTLSTEDFYPQLLRLIYRLIFLFVAEDRELLHPPGSAEEPKRRYADFYSTSRLRRLAERRVGTKHADLFEGFKVVARRLADPAGAPELGLPALGSLLWSERACPDLDGAQLPNQSFLRAIRALAFTEQEKVLRPVDYRNLGSEELGSVYESLLELHPEIHLESATFELKTAAGNERKTTGSYYTPSSLIAALLDSALDPVLAEAAGKTEAEAAILQLKVLDPACGSGHFLVAAAHRIARRLAGARTGEDEPSPEAYRTALRDVIARCVYGIDINPMAVELCKVSLWMEAVEPGKPLSFLENHIICGNSLLGTTPRLLQDGIPDEAFTALGGDDRAVVSQLKRRNHQERTGQEVLALGPSVADLARPLAEAVGVLEQLSADSPHDLRAKESMWSKIQASTEAERARFLADAWCAAFVIARTKGAPILTDGVLRMLRADSQGGDPKLHGEVRALAEHFRFLHPHLAFPDLFRLPASGEEPEEPQMGWSGGFDAVIGNPPWERVKLQEKEWFEVRTPQVAKAKNASTRKKLIEALATEDPPVYAEWLAALRQAEGESHLIRMSGRYPLCGRGDINTYAIFAELMRVVASSRGRTGIIVPTGIATDDTTKFFFRDLVEHRSLASLFDFENQGIFPGVHNSYKFSLMTLTGSARPVSGAEFVFYAHQPSDLLDAKRRFTLSLEDIALLNPNSRTCPVFRSGRDAELTKAIYRRIPVLIEEGTPERNPWGVRFMRLFDMTNDSEMFRTRDELESGGWKLEGNVFVRGEERWLPAYEGKMTSQYDHRAAHIRLNPSNPSRQQQPEPASLADHEDPSFVPEPFQWGPEKEVRFRALPEMLRWTLTSKRVTGSTNWRTMVACVIPGSAVSYTLYCIESSSDRVKSAVCLLAAFNSIPFDYLVRQKTMQPSLPLGVIYETAMLPPDRFDDPPPWDLSRTLFEWIRPRVLELTYTSWDLSAFARDLGCDSPPFRWVPDRRTKLAAELDASLFHLYGFNRDGVEHVLETFPVVRRNDERKYGEYQTKRLTLDRYDAISKAIATGESYQTVLAPSPGDASSAHEPGAA